MTALPKAVCGRPRGFIFWNPQAETKALLADIQEVIKEYEAQLPLTIRQVFYRLVVKSSLDKTEKGYKRLCETLNKARRSGLISFDAIRDDGFHKTGFLGYESADELKEIFFNHADKFKIDRQQGQAVRLVVWCEAAGMVPQLEAVTRPFSIPVYSSGGFDSLTAKYQVSREFADMGSVYVLHIGDHDPSGVHVYGSLAEDIQSFTDHYGGSVEFERLAVLPEHIQEYELPTAPPKPTDKRTFTGKTVQAEALPPDVLASILREKLESIIEPEAFQKAIQSEKKERQKLVKWLGEKS